MTYFFGLVFPSFFGFSSLLAFVLASCSLVRLLSWFLACFLAFLLASLLPCAFMLPCPPACFLCLLVCLFACFLVFSLSRFLTFSLSCFLSCLLPDLLCSICFKKKTLFVFLWSLFVCFQGVRHQEAPKRIILSDQCFALVLPQLHQ